MTKWYARRNFSIKTPLFLSRIDGALLKEEPPQDALFWKMWHECEDIAQAVLETDYFKGILNNDLDPNAYGSLMVQDAYYCFKALDSYTAAASHPYDDDCAVFLAGKQQSYALYNETYHSIWHIRDAYGVMPGQAISDYADYESYVAGNLITPYLFAVMLPCEYLWTWVANNLRLTADKDGLYYFWIEGNAGVPEGAYQMAHMLETYRTDIDESKAKEIFRTAMENELKVFTSATILESSLWLKQH